MKHTGCKTECNAEEDQKDHYDDEAHLGPLLPVIYIVVTLGQSELDGSGISELFAH